MEPIPLNKTSSPFLKTSEGRGMIFLDSYGYHLTSKQSDLTLNQELFILYGRSMLEKEKYDNVKGSMR